MLYSTNIWGLTRKALLSSPSTNKKEGMRVMQMKVFVEATIDLYADEKGVLQKEKADAKILEYYPDKELRDFLAGKDGKNE